jgi:succinoglycan biosynthesis protein ExoM
VCERSEKRLPWDLIYLEEEQRGEANARNRAVEEALRQGFDFLAFIDDDDTPQLDWLSNLLAAQRETDADIVCGAIPPVVESECPDWFKNSPLFDTQVEGSQTKYGLPKDIGIGNSLIRCKMLQGFRSQGPVFSEEFASVGACDLDFFIRATKSGGHPD